MKLINKSDNMW